MRIAAQHIDQMRQRLDRSVERIGADALVDHFAVSVERDRQAPTANRQALSRSLLAIGWRGPSKYAPCSPPLATQSAALKRQPGKIDCTISKP